MTTVDRLLADSGDIWARYHTHPFVRGIAEGTLAQDRFRHYMIQDYLYLIDYVRVFALGVAKARDTDTMGMFAEYVHRILNGEMDIHRGYMARLGISREEAEGTAVALDNRSYTAYMLQVAYEGGAAEIAAAILSCALSYEAIARRMVAQRPEAAGHPFYGEWVRGYADEEYHRANLALVELTERLAGGYSPEEIARLSEIFAACSRYELAFWDMAWEMRS